MNKNLQIILTLIIAILLVILGYFVFQNQQLISKLSRPDYKTPQLATNSPSPSPSSSPIVSASPTPQPTLIATQNAIETNINSKNYQNLITYMTTPKVNFSIMSSECCEPQSPAETITQLSYINDGIPFDFNQNTQVVKNLKSKNLQLADTFIGISTNHEHLIAISLDNQSKISGIQVSVSWKLYEN